MERGRKGKRGSGGTGVGMEGQASVIDSFSLTTTQKDLEWLP